MATPQSPKLLFWVQVLVSALPCPNRKSLHTRLTVRQLSLKQSMQVCPGGHAPLTIPVCESTAFLTYMAYMVS